VKAGSTSLYTRVTGRGIPLIVLHGGPDFDHSYFLPDLDRFAKRFRLIYYDQRGRGRSADHVTPGEVTLASELEDLDTVRRHFRLQPVALLGHSWGAVLALEYALRHPQEVSSLILMNPAPVSAGDLALFRKAYVRKMGSDMDRQKQIVAGAAYQEGDPDAVTERYRLHFKPAIAEKDGYERLMMRMKAEFARQGKEGIVKARAVEERLMDDTWRVAGYDLLPKLQRLPMPALVIAGDHDFIPEEIGERIAAALPKGKLVKTANCGHFAFLECPEKVEEAFRSFFTEEKAKGDKPPR
jgi:proline iminopeptidase